MKKSLLAVAVFGAFASAGAQAQTSVTMFGIVDAAFATTSGPGGQGFRGVSSSGINSSRWGVRGTEDLGGGLKAGFWLEAALGNDDGRAGGSISANNSPLANTVAGNTGLNFHRRSTVSLMGGFGEIRIGRDYQPTFWNATIFDPFGTNGVGAFRGYGALTGSGAQVRSSNSIGYFLPNLGGIYGQLMVAFGETGKLGTAAGTQPKDGDYVGGRLGYANGPIDVAAAFGTHKLQAVGDVKYVNVGGTYNFGFIKPALSWFEEKTSTVKVTSYNVGLTAPLGGGEARLAVSEIKTDLAGDPKGRQIGVGYVYNLSRRTAPYIQYATFKGDGLAGTISNNGIGGVSSGATGTSKGLEIGLRHSF
jgi:predicted porin